MEKAQILETLDEIYGTQIPDEVTEADRWNLYEELKSKLKGLSPDQYTAQIILIAEALEL